MRKQTSLLLKRAFFLLATFAIFAYFFVPKIVLNFMESTSVTGIEEVDNPPELKREVEAIQVIRNEGTQSNEEIQTTIGKEQDTIDINKEEEMQTVDSGLDERLRKRDEENKLRRQEEAAREAELHKRMESSIEKFMENIKSPDWYK